MRFLVAEPRLVKTVSNRIVSTENSIPAELSVMKSMSRLHELDKPMSKVIRIARQAEKVLRFLIIGCKSKNVELFDRKHYAFL